MTNYVLMLGSGIKVVILLLIGFSVLGFVVPSLDFVQAMKLFWPVFSVSIAEDFDVFLPLCV